MLESALKIMMFMWSVSFSVFGGQYVIADVIGITLINSWTDFDGDGIVDNIELKPYLLSIIDEETINETTENIVTGNFTGNSTYYDPVETFTTAAAFVAWELVTLLSGTYIFNLMFLMGVPPLFIAFFVILFLALLSRAIIGYVRGI
jgi:hypothetical protein